MTDRYSHPSSQPIRRGASLWRATYHSLQFKVSLLVVLLILAIIGCGTSLSLRAMGTALFQNELDLTRQWAGSLALTASQEITTDCDLGSCKKLQDTVRTLVRTQTVAYVAFARPDGTIVASAESQAGLLQMAFPRKGGKLKLDLLETPRLVRHTESGLMCIDVVAPILATASHLSPPATAATPKAIVGYVRLATNASSSTARLNEIASGLLRIDLAVVLLIIPGCLLITRHIVAPLNRLAATARALANGAMDARVPVTSQDELGQLAQSFNVMANRVTQSQMELLQLATELEARVEQRTQELEELASKDPLTGLANRRHFSGVLAHEFASAERYHSDLTCLMFDVDHFKQVNDRFGHGVGDAVLILLARTIQNQLRSSDVAARFGGDEFILLLPQTSASAASSLAGRIMQEFAIEGKRQYPDLPAGLSIGVASLRDTRASSAEVLTKEADKALYAAKARGRNCLVEAGCSASAAVDTVPVKF